MRLKMISSIGFLCIAAACLIIIGDPATGYELSVYEAVSPVAWVLLILPILCGIGIVVYQAFKNEDSHTWLIGILLILSANFVIILLPYLRGYIFSSGHDHITHIGDARTVMLTGHAVRNHLYPISQITLSELSFVLGISLESLANFIGPSYYLLFVLFTYFFCRTIIPRKATILAVLASTVLYCYYYVEIFPLGFTYIMLPFFFSLYFSYLRRPSVYIGVSLVIMIIFFAFSHLVASVTLSTTLFLLEITKIIHNRLLVRRSRKFPIIDRNHTTTRSTFSFAVLSLMITLLWLWSSNWAWGRAVQGILALFNNELQLTSVWDMAASSFLTLGLSFSQIILLFIQLYGHYFIYLGLSFVAFILIWKKGKYLESKNRKYIIYLSVLVSFAITVWLVDYVVPLTDLSSGRFLFMAAALLPPIVGLSLYLIYSIVEGKSTHPSKGSISSLVNIRTAKVGIWVALAFCAVVGVFGIYPSPLTYRAHLAINKSQMEEANWTLEHADYEKGFYYLGTNPIRRYIAAIEGTFAWVNTLDFGQQRVVDHFGYDSGNSEIVESLEANSYIRIREDYLITIYDELFTNIRRFTVEDFVSLEGDYSANKLYNNGEVQVWYIED